MVYLKNILISLVLITVFLSCSNSNNTHIADILYNKGRELYNNAEYIESLNVFMRTREAAVSEKNDTTLMKTLLAIGNVHTVFDDYEQAVRFYSACYTKALEVHDDNMLRNSANNMLICYSLLGKGKEALACYHQLKDAPSRGKKADALFSYVNQGLVAQAQKNMKMSCHYFKYALDYAINNGMGDAMICSLYGMLGKTEYEAGDFRKAEEHYLASLDLALKGGSSTVLCSIYEKLTDLYRTMGDGAKELHYLHLNVQLTDSVFNRQSLYDKQGEIIDEERRKTDEEMLSLNHLISQQWWIIGIICTLMGAMIVLIVITVKQNRSLLSAQRLLISKHREHLRHEQVEKELRDEYLNAVHSSHSEANASQTAPLLTTQQTEALLAEIGRVICDMSVISNPDFSLQQLAQMTQSNTKYVSWVINTTYNKNFKTFINDYRIEEASKMLVDRENYGHLTLHAICQMVGFKSTTSFNTAFKRIIGMTPSAYQRLYSEEQN